MGIAIFQSDEEIIQIIKCEKRILKKPSGPKPSNRETKQKFELETVDGAAKFEVFFAQNSRLPRDFSLGLMVEKFMLIRYNGFHGTTRAGYHRFQHHENPHSHTLTVDDILSSRESAPTKIDDMTGNYLDYEGAKLFFLRSCGIINYADYFDFSRYNQLTFDDLDL